ERLCNHAKSLRIEQCATEDISGKRHIRIHRHVEAADVIDLIRKTRIDASGWNAASENGLIRRGASGEARVRTRRKGDKRARNLAARQRVSEVDVRLDAGNLTRCNKQEF